MAGGFLTWRGVEATVASKKLETNTPIHDISEGPRGSQVCTQGCTCILEKHTNVEHDERAAAQQSTQENDRRACWKCAVIDNIVFKTSTGRRERLHQTRRIALAHGLPNHHIRGRTNRGEAKPFRRRFLLPCVPFPSPSLLQPVGFLLGPHTAALERRLGHWLSLYCLLVAQTVPLLHNFPR